MAEHNDGSLFYFNIFKIAQGMVKSWFINRLLQELDEYLRGRGNAEDPRNPTRAMFDERHFQEIVEIFGQRNLERMRFCEIFPRWKENRQGMVASFESIARQLHEDKEKIEELETANNVLGLTGGLLRAISEVSQTMPGWVGATGKAISAVSSGVKATINVVEQCKIETLLRKAENYSKSDKENFRVLLRWFHYDEELTDAIKAAIGTDTMQKLFEKFQNFYDKVRNFNENHPKVRFIADFFESIASMALPLKSKLIGGLLQIFIIHYADRSRSSWTSSAKSMERVKAGALVLTYSANAILSAQQFRGEWNTPGATYVGIAVDVLPAVFDLFKKKKDEKKKGSASNQGDHIEKVARALTEELNFFENVYNRVKDSDTAAIP